MLKSFIDFLFLSFLFFVKFALISLTLSEGVTAVAAQVSETTPTPSDAATPKEPTACLCLGRGDCLSQR